MESVCEGATTILAIGRTFEEALQKGLRMIGQGMHGFTGNRPSVVDDIEGALKSPTDRRVFVIADAMEHGMTVGNQEPLLNDGRRCIPRRSGSRCM